MSFSLIKMLGARLTPVHVVDVGAMWMGEDKLGYQPLLDAGVGRVVGFEANQAECDKLNALGRPHSRYLPHVVGDGREATFYLCQDPMTSSIYEPNLALLNRFNMLGEITRPVSSSPCRTRRLDDIAEIAAIDLLQVDVQGAELDVIRGAQERLRDAAVVVAEVEFVEMYKGQPLFADVDAEMRRQGFCLHLLGPSMGPAFKPFAPGGDPWKGVRQALWTDAVFVKDFMKFGELKPEQLLKIAAILYELFGSVDLTALALQHYDAKTGAATWREYVTALGGGSLSAPPL